MTIDHIALYSDFNTYEVTVICAVKCNWSRNQADSQPPGCHSTRDRSRVFKKHESNSWRIFCWQRNAHDLSRVEQQPGGCESAFNLSQSTEAPVPFYRNIVSLAKCFLLCFSRQSRCLWRTAANRRIVKASEALASRIGTKFIGAKFSNMTAVGRILIKCMVIACSFPLPSLLIMRSWLCKENICHGLYDIFLLLYVTIMLLCFNYKLSWESTMYICVNACGTVRLDLIFLATQEHQQVAVSFAFCYSASFTNYSTAIAHHVQCLNILYC